jgi:hypothetical protein
LSTAQYGGLSTSQYGGVSTSQYGGLSTSTGDGLSTSNSNVYMSNIPPWSIFVKYLYENSSIIDILTVNEAKELIRGLTKSITWNGTTENLIVCFNDKNDN